jgi:ribosomal protein L31E
MNTVKQLVKKHMLVSQDAPRLVALTRQRLQKQLMSAQKLAMKQAVNARITARPNAFQ